MCVHVRVTSYKREKDEKKRNSQIRTRCFLLIQINAVCFFFSSVSSSYLAGNCGMDRPSRLRLLVTGLLCASFCLYPAESPFPSVPPRLTTHANPTKKKRKKKRRRKERPAWTRCFMLRSSCHWTMGRPRLTAAAAAAARASPPPARTPAASAGRRRGGPGRARGQRRGLA